MAKRRQPDRPEDSGSDPIKGMLEILERPIPEIELLVFEAGELMAEEADIHRRGNSLMEKWRKANVTPTAILQLLDDNLHAQETLAFKHIKRELEHGARKTLCDLFKVNGIAITDIEIIPQLGSKQGDPIRWIVKIFLSNQKRYGLWEGNIQPRLDFLVKKFREDTNGETPQEVSVEQRIGDQIATYDRRHELKPGDAPEMNIEFIVSSASLVALLNKAKQWKDAAPYKESPPDPSVFATEPTVQSVVESMSRPFSNALKRLFG